MNFVVTARKWRPQLFEDVVGQEHITKTLKNAIVNNRIAHAFIFAGPRGVGKTTTARILAKSLNCLEPNAGEPCNKCEMCKSFQSAQSLDIIEIDGASNRRIEEIRALRESVKYAPSKGRYKIYIIDEVHMLTNESFNALLKTLEEPPEHTIFVFATTDIHKVPLTIISRCQRFDFRRIELDAIKNQLKHIAENEKIKIDDQSLTLISKKADGALRDAQSLFDQVISFCGTDIKSEDIFQMLNLINEEIYFELTTAILNKKFVTAFDISKQIYDNGWNYIDFFNGLIEHFRNVLTVVITGNHKLIESAEIFKNKYLEYGNSFSEGDILRILNYLNKSIIELKNTQNQKLKTELALSHLIGLEKSATISGMLAKFGSNSTNNESLSPATKKQPLFHQSKNEVEENPIEAKKQRTKIEFQQPHENKIDVPTVSINSDLDEVVNKWSEFVSFVEKDFTFGPLLTNSKPLGIKDTKLEIIVDNQEDIEHLNTSKDKLNIRLKEFYGQAVNVYFSFSKKPVINDDRKEKKELYNNISPSNDPLTRAVIDQFGGREIK